MKFVDTRTSFKAGVLSPKLNGRIDIREYGEALSVGDNALIGKLGGARKREGSFVLADLAASPNVRLETVFVNGQSLILVLGPDYFKVLNNDGQDLSAGGGDHQGSFVGAVDQFDVAVYENKIVVTHYSGDMIPYYINLDDNGFYSSRVAIGLGNIYAQPMVKYQGAITLKIKNLRDFYLGTDNYVVIESSGSYFTNDMVTERIMITGLTRIQGSNRIGTNYYTIFQVDSGTEVRAYPHYILNEAKARFGYNIDLLANMEYDTSDDLYLGLGGIDYKGSGVPADIADESNVFDEFYTGAWSNRLGWPKTVAVDEGRLIFGGSKTYPARLWGSRTNDPFFFLDRRFFESDFSWRIGSRIARNEKFQVEYSGEIEETDPYQFTIAAQRGSIINWMRAGVNFFVGTTDQEFIISGAAGSPISQKSISVRPHTSHGSSRLLSISFDNVVLYTNRAKTTIQMFLYNESNGSYISKELSLFNEDYLEDRIKQMVWHEEDGVCYILTNAGTIVALTLNNETQTIAFTRYEDELDVRSIAYFNNDGLGYAGLAAAVFENGRLVLQRFSQDNRDIPTYDLPLDKIQILDNRMIQPSGTDFRTTKTVNQDLDIFYFNPYELKVGDEIVFESSNATILDPTGLSLSTTYYAIPYYGDTSGFHVASSLANAQANIPISFAGTGIQNYTDILEVRVNRTVQEIPTKHIPSGMEVYVFADNGTSVEEFTFTSDGNDTYNLGKQYVGVAYGYTYNFLIGTMPVEAGQQWGSAQLGIKRVDKAGVRFYKTYSFNIGAGDKLDYVWVGDDYTGRVQTEISGSPEYDHIIYIQNNRPEPCHITGLALRGVSNDG